MKGTPDLGYLGLLHHLNLSKWCKVQLDILVDLMHLMSLLIKTPGWTRELGDHTQMHMKKIGTSFHQDLTWEINVHGILLTSAQGA